MSLKKFLKAVKQIEEQKYEQFSEPKEPAPHDDSNWLVSYADMMTLLCAFFIMLFSMAKLDQPQYEKVREAVSQQFGGDYQAPNKDLAKFVSEVVQQAGLDKQAIVKTEPIGVSVVFQSTVFFDTLSSEVKPEGKAVLNKLIEAVAARQGKESKEYKIVVEGHTDSRPIVSGIFATNWELSGARAARVVRMFIDRGFAPDHMTAIGYGDTRPESQSRKSDGSWDESLLAKNRRVVLRILDPTVDSIPFPESNGSSKRAPAEAPQPKS